jgi:hypothetical protein
VVQEEGWESSRSDIAGHEGRLAMRASMATRRSSGHRRIAHGRRAPALFMGRRVDGGSHKSSHGMGTSGCNDVCAVGSQLRTTGGEGRRGATCGRVVRGTGQWARKRHAQEHLGAAHGPMVACVLRSARTTMYINDRRGTSGDVEHVCALPHRNNSV